MFNFLRRSEVPPTQMRIVIRGNNLANSCRVRFMHALQSQGFTSRMVSRPGYLEIVIEKIAPVTKPALAPAAVRYSPALSTATE